VRYVVNICQVSSFSKESFSIPCDAYGKLVSLLNASLIQVQVHSRPLTAGARLVQE